MSYRRPQWAEMSRAQTYTHSQVLLTRFSHTHPSVPPVVFRKDLEGLVLLDPYFSTFLMLGPFNRKSFLWLLHKNLATVINCSVSATP